MNFYDYAGEFIREEGDFNNNIINHQISLFTDDSRKCKKNAVFFAIKGINNDGNTLIDNAINNGAKSIICEKIPKKQLIGVNYIKVKSSKNLYYETMLHFAKNKLSKIKIIGVTGTNGKTTVTTLCYGMLKYLNLSTMLIGTNGSFVYNNKTKKETKIKTPNTTPKLPIILEMIIKFPQIDYLIMEVSSEALLTKRIDGLKFDIVAFTNIGHDHLNTHNCFKEYINAKLKLFKLCKKDGNAVININDPNSKYFIYLANKLKLNIRTFGNLKSDLEGEILAINKDYMMIKVYSSNYEYVIGTNLIGRFNLLNILTALSILEAEKISINNVLGFFERPIQIKGRYEKYYINSRNVYIDYAHNPEAIKEFLIMISKIKENNKVITLIGAGGNKDEKKRPKMGEYSTLYSDLVIFTEDNSRNENIENIIADLIKGTKKDNYIIEYNRDIAIKKAFFNSSKDDFILLLGMGLDKYKNNKTDLQMIKEVIINE